MSNNYVHSKRFQRYIAKLPSQLRNLILYATPWVFAFSDFQLDLYQREKYEWYYFLSSWCFASCWPYSTSLSIQVWILYENCQFLSNRIPDCCTYIANCHMCDIFPAIKIFVFSLEWALYYSAMFSDSCLHWCGGTSIAWHWEQIFWKCRKTAKLWKDSSVFFLSSPSFLGSSFIRSRKIFW